MAKPKKGAPLALVHKPNQRMPGPTIAALKADANAAGVAQPPLAEHRTGGLKGTTGRKGAK